MKGNHYIFLQEYNMQREKTFEEKMLQFEETSLRFQETVLKSLIRIEAKLKTTANSEELGSVVDIITGNLHEVHEHISQQGKLSKSASDGGRKFTKKNRK
jgi:hypothetical protein